ncbi:MAG: DUF2179 domain-containing protein [Anaerolineae bacterium]|nr:DUF2179 domain-containing protein [Anaerolineae bacterium]
MMDIVIQALLILVLRIFGIAISTLGTILTVQGRKLPAILTGSLSALVYILAIAQVVNHMDNLWYVSAYVAGYGLGTWVGMILEERLALGYAEVRIISINDGETVAAALRKAGFGVTEIYGRGQESPVGIIEAIVPRKRVSDAVRLAEKADERAMVTVYEARTVQRGYLRPDRRR